MDATLPLRLLVRAALFVAVLTTVAAAQDTTPKPSPLYKARGIVAEVNGDPIIYGQLEAELEKRLRENVVPPEAWTQAKRELRPRVLDQMIAEKLMLQHCDLQGVDVTAAEIDDYIRREMQRIREGGTQLANLEEFFRFMFQATGDSEEELRKQFGEFVRVQKLLRQKVWKQEFITPRQLRTYYLEHQGDFTTETVHFVRFLIVPRDAELDATVKEIEAALDAKTPFEEIMKKHGPATLDDETQGIERIEGDSLDSYKPPIPDAVRALAPGQVSPRLQFRNSVAYVKLEQREEGRALSFDTPEAQELIRERIAAERRDRQYARFVRELRANATIDVFPDQLDP